MSTHIFPLGPGQKPIANMSSALVSMSMIGLSFDDLPDGALLVTDRRGALDLHRQLGNQQGKAYDRIMWLSEHVLAIVSHIVNLKKQVLHATRSPLLAPSESGHSTAESETASTRSLDREGRVDARVIDDQEGHRAFRRAIEGGNRKKQTVSHH